MNVAAESLDGDRRAHAPPAAEGRAPRARSPARELATRRLALLPVLLLGITLLVFLLGRMLPGDPAVAFAGGERANPRVVEEIRREWGLEDPLPVQYLRYVGRVAQGDLGWSVSARADVADVLRDRLPATLELATSGLLLGVPAGLLLGVRSATRLGSRADDVARTIAITGVSVPVFWVGFMLVYLFSVRLGWLPLSGRLPPFSDFRSLTGVYTLDAVIRGDFGALSGILRHLALPAITLAIAPGAIVARFARASFVDVLGESYIRTAVAYGLNPRTIVWRLAAKNAFLPLITLMGLLVGSLIVGSVLVETVFSWPGMGTFLFGALAARDYAAVQSVTLLVGVTYVVVNLLIDLSYLFLDPRTRRG